MDKENSEVIPVHLRNLIAILLIVALANATAPTWVASGAMVKYTVGTDTITFTVLSRNTTDVVIRIDTLSTSKSRTISENASADYGQFWYDSDLLGGSYIGGYVGEFTADSEGSQTFAGKEWGTINISSTLSGALTKRIYEKRSGLLLRQTVDAVGAPSVTLIQYAIPAFGTTTPPTTTTCTTSCGSGYTQGAYPGCACTCSRTCTSPQVLNSTSCACYTPATTSPVTTPPATTPPQQNVTAPPTQNTTPPSTDTPPATSAPTTNKKKPLCPSSAAIVLLLGAVVALKRN